VAVVLIYYETAELANENSTSIDEFDGIEVLNDTC